MERALRQVESVKFVAFTEATREDFELIADHDAENASRNADRVLDWLRLMDGPSPYQVSRLEHCLQSASRAQADGADDEMIVVDRASPRFVPGLLLVRVLRP